MRVRCVRQVVAQSSSGGVRQVPSRHFQSSRAVTAPSGNSTSSGGSTFKPGIDFVLLPAFLGFGVYLHQTDYMQTRGEKSSVLALKRALGEEDFKETRVVFDAEEYPNGVNHNFMQKDTEKIVKTFCGQCGRFENPETRDIAAALPKVIELLDSHPKLGIAGRRVLDVGAGSGLFMKPIVDCQHKPNETKSADDMGTYHAIEISPTFVDALSARAANEVGEEKWVAASQCTDRDTGRPAASADLAIVVDVYHHFELPLTFMRSLRQTLAPGGMLVVLDFHRDDAKITSHPKGWVYKHVRAGQEEFRKEIISCGFELVDEPDIPELKENYVMIFRRL